MSARYTLQQHPAFSEPLSKEDLHALISAGSLTRGEMCLDEVTGHAHTVGEVISGMRRLSASSGQPRINRPAYREISPDSESLEQEAIIEKKNAGDEVQYTPGGELILHHAHPSWIGYPKSFLLCLLLSIVGIQLFHLNLEYAIIALIGSVSTLVTIGITRYSHDYIVTGERVELIWGIIGRSSKEARICDIRSIDVYERGFKGLLGLGTIHFSTAANAGIDVQFKDMHCAHEVKDLVRTLQGNLSPTED